MAEDRRGKSDDEVLRQRKRKLVAVCTTCKRNMATTDGCDEAAPILTPDGKGHPFPKFGENERDEGMERCPDCNARRGHPHHPGCDWERCPVCNGQTLVCGGFHSRGKRDGGYYIYEDASDCEGSGDHLKSCDDDGYCNLCGEQ